MHSPAPRSNAPVPCASPAPLQTIGGAVATGRTTNLVGTAISASTGTISQEQIATRPLLRPGDVLEDIPGLVISQHSGGGKANQYYLRGFQLDHGTNLESVFDGVPVNLGTHAHGQGYSDINDLIPELVGSVEFKKGTYFADQGVYAW
jgi:outer membrane cobalamin receptor